MTRHPSTCAKRRVERCGDLRCAGRHRRYSLRSLRKTCESALTREKKDRDVWDNNFEVLSYYVVPHSPHLVIVCSGSCFTYVKSVPGKGANFIAFAGFWAAFGANLTRSG